jgi:hypothetical protein
MYLKLGHANSRTGPGGGSGGRVWDDGRRNEPIEVSASARKDANTTTSLRRAAIQTDDTKNGDGRDRWQHHGRVLGRGVAVWESSGLGSTGGRAPRGEEGDKHDVRGVSGQTDGTNSTL